MSTMPSVFVSHGAPTLILDDVPARAFLAALGKQMPRPKAIIAVSAHWETERPTVSLAAKPETMHDFYGFPQALYRLRYPAPGAPELARRVAGLIGADTDPGRGLDHGAWVPAMLGWPEADIAIFQLSIQPHLGPAHHVEIGRKLSPLREEGVLVLGSGSSTHNLRSLARDPQAAPQAWAREFDDWLEIALTRGDEAALVDYRARAPHAREAHPTDEHFLPIHVAFGAAGEGAHGRALHRSFTLGSLSMASYAFA